MKKYFVVIALVLALSSTAVAFAPLLIPAWVYGPSAAVAVSTAALGLYYGMNSGAVSQIDVSGNIARASTAILAHMQGGSAVLSSFDLDAELSFAAMKALAAGNPTQYPLVKAALIDAIVLPSTTKTGVPSVGDTFTVNGVAKIATSITYYSGSHTYTGPSLQYNGVNFTNYHDPSTATGASGTTYPGYYSIIASSYTPAPADLTPLQAAQKLSGTAGTSTQPITSAYQAEIDKMYQDPDYVPRFTDKTTGLPWSPPSGILTPEQLAVYNTAGVAAQAAAVAAAQATAAATSATQAATNAQTRTDAAESVLAADPANPALIAERDRLKGLSDAAAAVAAAAVALQAKTDAAVADNEATQAKENADNAEATPAKPAKKTINLDAFKSLVGIMAVTYPFNLPLVIKSYFEALSVAGSSAPVFDLPMPLDKVLHVDLAIFDPLATVIRYMVGIVITCGMMFYIVHFFRGIS